MLIYVKYKNNKINAHAPTTQLKNYRFTVLKKKKITITVSLRVQASLSPKKWCKKGDSGGLDSDVCIESENFPIGL